tara:strand:- start:1005 stop:1124 length:120 start_codon:yes stop_codon:yes gene_type:complete
MTEAREHASSAAQWVCVDYFLFATFSGKTVTQPDDAISD